MKKISVAMITYNHEKYIRKALDSILAQKTNFDYEIVIGNDGSPDLTHEIIEEYSKFYPGKIKNLYRDKNVGVVKNILDVYENCNGEYIALLEGDDYWESDEKLQKMIEFLDNNQNYIGAFHNINVVDENNKFQSNHQFHQSSNYSDINSLEEHYEGKVMMTLTMVFRNVFLNKKELKEYKEMLNGIMYVCDYSLKAFLLNKGAFKYFPQIMGNYRYVSNSGTSWSAQSQEIKNEDFLKIYKNHINKFGQIAFDKVSISYLRLFLKTNFLYLKNRKILKMKLLFEDFDYSILNKKFFLKIFKKIKTKL